MTAPTPGDRGLVEPLIRASNEPSRSIAVTSNVTPASGQDYFVGVEGLRVERPALANRLTIAHVDRDGDPFSAMRCDHPPDERRVAQGSGSQDDASGAQVEGGSHAVLVAQPTRDLDTRPIANSRHKTLQHLSVYRDPRPGAVEIDHVQQEARHRRRSATSWVVAVRSLPGEVSLLEPNHPATAQVDRR
jgi:hypothetical protein